MNVLSLFMGTGGDGGIGSLWGGELPQFQGWHFNRGFGVFDWIQIAIILGAGLLITLLVVRTMDATASHHRFDPLRFGPLRSLVKWAGFLIIITLILRKFGFDVVTAVSAVLALIAVGFVAVWSVLSNFLCTFLLLIYRPFRVNDYIEFPGGDDIRGKVIALTTLYTVLEDDDGSIFHVPNNQFFQKAIKLPKRTESAKN